MANDKVRNIRCRGEEFWSQDGGSHRQNTKRSEPVPIAVFKVDDADIIKELSINEPGYSLIASSMDGVRFQGVYDDSISEPGGRDQGKVHFEHYKHNKRHCFVGDYIGDYNRSEYIGICHIFLDEIEDSYPL